MGMTAAVIAGTLVGAVTSGLNAYEQKRAGDRIRIFHLKSFFRFIDFCSS